MRTVVCGIGNRVRGDDATGPMVIDKLKKTITNDDILLLDCEHFPENFMKRILDFHPDRMILIDTADFGGAPGDFQEIDIESIKKQALSTHKMPLTMFINYLKARIDFETVFLGVQPKHTGFDKPVSEECKSAVEQVTTRIIEIIG